MEGPLEFIVQFGAFILLSIILIALRNYINKAKRKRCIANYPSAENIKIIKNEIRALKDKKVTYQTILKSISQTYEIDTWIARGLIIEVEKESVANIKETKSLQKNYISFNYPGNWKIQSVDKNLDSNLAFAIEGSYSAIICFALLGAVSEEIPSFNELLMKFKPEYDEFQEISKIEQWGTFQGEGIEFSAKDVVSPAKGFIFQYKDGKNSFYITQVSAVDDIDNTADGFRLIESTFRILN